MTQYVNPTNADVLRAVEGLREHVDAQMTALRAHVDARLDAQTRRSCTTSGRPCEPSTRGSAPSSAARQAKTVRSLHGPALPHEEGQMPKQPQSVPKDDPRYQPTKAELEQDVSIRDATPEDLALAVVGKHPRRVTH